MHTNMSAADWHALSCHFEFNMAWNFVGKPKSGTETALDACDYFVDEVIELTRCLDAREQVRMIKHRELRQAVVSSDERTVRVLLEALGSERQVIANMAPAGANSLLFIAVQAGHEGITNRLLDAGADGRSHAVTKYSPLYAAVHHGHYNIAKLLLEKFPDLVKQPTVEHWLPLHAACINGHIPLLELLIYYKYPDYLYNAYRDENGEWEWRLPFDPNALDVTGQTSLYISSILGNKSLVNVLLNWRVKCHKTLCIGIGGSDSSLRDAINEEIINGNSSSCSTPITPTRKRISFGIQAIMSKLHISSEGENLIKEVNECEKCPVNLNLLCGAARETALLAAVRGGFVDVASLLLQHGADPNIMAKPVEDHNDPKCTEGIYGLSNIPIAEACKQRSLPILELLLKYGARDDNGSALGVAVVSNDEAILSRLLAKRVHPDSDYKINKKCLPTPVEVNMFSPSINNISYSEMFPNTPTIIDWHNNSNVQLSFVRINWMVNGVLQLNPKLQRHPMVNDVALTAITRIDLSHNNLNTLPSEIFKLVSLKYLNIAQNKITSLPTPSQTSFSKCAYSCPALEELFIQDNRLISIPVEIFHLPSLTIFDISNNKLQELPFDMWKTPKLRELNIAFNLLKDLPVPPMQTSTSQLSLDKLELETFSGSDSTDICNIKPRNLSFHQLIHCNIWSKSLEIIDNDMKWNRAKKEEGVSNLNSLNIANNLFTSIPAALPCLAANLTRLNMSYNSLRSMGHVTSYPSTLKQLDLSHNEISCWPSLPRITTDFDPHLLCYSFVDIICNDKAEEALSFSKPVVTGKATSFRSTVLKSVCRHRRHLRLESLRTLILADNLFTRIQLSTDDISTLFNESDDADWSVVGVTKSKLIFPNLSMLDISNNCLKEIPTSLHELSSLSVLNISGNVNITDLPPHIGLLSRLWNLNTRGCLLQEPLKSMIESKKYKTMDIIGYLKSIYENSVTYARMKLMVVGVQGIGKTTLLDLLRQGGGSQKTRASENNWAKRMGHVRNIPKGSRFGNISTVGVDIGIWICEKRKKAPGSYGPVTFRTWDFGGQTEYYATHQYFLSKRSLYLVLWKITDGHKGLVEILQWLGNIQFILFLIFEQARAPNSAVIIVGTHFDAVGETISAQHAEELQQLIREKFIAIPDAEKIGLPRVIDSIEISCRTMHNIRLLANIIYDAAFMLRSPGSKEPLLLQKIPASYIALEDIVNVIACNLRSAGVDPVLNADEYRKLVTEEMRLHNYKHFRDAAELNQATMFLHDNGVILHYDDATLRDYYFLDPQWLCDMLAHVVTVREINPFARNGIMKMDDLGQLFRGTEGQCNNNRSYIVCLLNKFEVALTWDSRTLLIPSLLPNEENATLNASTIVKVFQRSRARNLNSGTSNEINLDNFAFKPIKCDTNEEFGFDVGLRRILLMTYFPSGFWSRILTRLLADDQITEAIKYIYLPESCVDCFSFGMFIYENISLRQPFEGQESIKECILDGSRPPLTQREIQFPTYCLDLMVLCWDDEPKKRPSASQIVSILTAPECIHLLDAIVIPHNEKIVCGAFKVLATTEDEAAGFELWLPAYNSRIDILDVTPSGSCLQGSSIKCANRLQIDNSPCSNTGNGKSGTRSRSHSVSRQYKINMLCCCLIEDCIWIGDAAGTLHSYNTTNWALLFAYMLDPAIKSPVITLIYLPNIERVAIGLENGRVFLVDSKKIPTNCAFAEGSFVLTEICSGLILHSACSALVDDKYELWCGEMAGKINVFPLSKTGVSGHQTLCHSEEPNIIEDVKVARMCATDSFVFSCLYPGFVVYQWSVRSKTIENKLDCSKLLPCSESLKSISIDEHLSLLKCQISAMASHGNELYIGTTWGCLIITELSTLRPITVFRPYENEIKSIIAVPHPKCPLIATIGRRYRSLISRYMDSIDDANSHVQAAMVTHNEKERKTRSSSRDMDSHIHVLLWRAKNWS
ncbi:leucine-rich repeat serine/threonine-protein kinase 1 isoform X10 [Eurosta solidaginis]|uniref:leucine-rich repeat serine/threonine-protein kinase 1 isoform X10 n=1 Tax=Eurosta solidaginis TaxID=178769 RepID=UPI003530CE42